MRRFVVASDRRLDRLTPRMEADLRMFGDTEWLTAADIGTTVENLRRLARRKLVREARLFGRVRFRLTLAGVAAANALRQKALFA